MKVPGPSLRNSNYRLILWVEVIGFLLIIALTWLDEAVILRGGMATGGWKEALRETILIIFVAVPTVTLTWRLLSHLYKIEHFIRMCAWCRKLDRDGDWLSMEDYFGAGADVTFSHGICTECLEKYREQYNLGPRDSHKHV